MIPSVVSHAVRQGKERTTGIVVTELPARCFPQHVLNVAGTPRYHLNLAVIDQYTVVIAIENLDRAYILA